MFVIFILLPYQFYLLESTNRNNQVNTPVDSIKEVLIIIKNCAKIKLVAFCPRIKRFQKVANA